MDLYLQIHAKLATVTLVERTDERSRFCPLIWHVLGNVVEVEVEVELTHE